MNNFLYEVMMGGSRIDLDLSLMSAIYNPLSLKEVKSATVMIKYGL